MSITINAWLRKNNAWRFLNIVFGLSQYYVCEVKKKNKVKRTLCRGNYQVTWVGESLGFIVVLNNLSVIWRRRSPESVSTYNVPLRHWKRLIKGKVRRPTQTIAFKCLVEPKGNGPTLTITLVRVNQWLHFPLVAKHQTRNFLFGSHKCDLTQNSLSSAASQKRFTSNVYAIISRCTCPQCEQAATPNHRKSLVWPDADLILDLPLPKRTFYQLCCPGRKYHVSLIESCSVRRIYGLIFNKIITSYDHWIHLIITEMK